MSAARVEFNGKSYNRAFVRLVAEVERKQLKTIPLKGEFKSTEIEERIRTIIPNAPTKILIALKKAGIIQYEDLEYDTDSRLLYERDVKISPKISNREKCRKDLDAALRTLSLSSEELEGILDRIKELYDRDYLMESAARKIFDARYSYDFSLPRKTRLSQARETEKCNFIETLTHLGLISQASKGTALVKLSRSYDAAIAELKEKIDQAGTAAIEFRKLFYDGVAGGIQEALKMIMAYPAVKGFEGSSDAANIPDAAVKHFMLEAISEDIMRRLLIRKIGKHDCYYICKINDEDSKKLSEAGIRLGSVNGVNAVRSQKEYEAAAMLLEGVDNPDQLTHVHNGMGTSGIAIGGSFKYSEIYMGNLSMKHYSSREYYEELEGFTEQEKKMSFMLGLLAHEVAHKYVIYSNDVLSRNILIDYEKETKDERNDRPYVTDYVRWHKDIYKSSEALIIEEDLCETIHAYVVNPEYLEREFPARYTFIKKHLPFIKAGAAAETVKEIRLKG